MNILLIEDNISIIKGLTYSFTKNNYHIIAKTTIKDTLEYLNSNPNLDLIILDITLPDGNGYNFFKSTLKHLNIPIIFLTANDEENIIVSSLNEGAEDYLTKPFSIKELLVRVNKIILRTKKSSIIKVKDLTFDFDKLILTKNNKPLDLTPLELKIINLLFLNINKVVSRNFLLDKIWEWTGNYIDDHTITVYFNRIREKIGPNIITTIKGMGYRIDAE